jgi:hypothetical protein
MALHKGKLSIFSVPDWADRPICFNMREILFLAWILNEEKI